MKLLSFRIVRCEDDPLDADSSLVICRYTDSKEELKYAFRVSNNMIQDDRIKQFLETREFTELLDEVTQ